MMTTGVIRSNVHHSQRGSAISDWPISVWLKVHVTNIRASCLNISELEPYPAPWLVRLVLTFNL